MTHVDTAPSGLEIEREVSTKIYNSISTQTETVTQTEPLPESSLQIDTGTAQVSRNGSPTNSSILEYYSAIAPLEEVPLSANDNTPTVRQITSKWLSEVEIPEGNLGIDNISNMGRSSNGSPHSHSSLLSPHTPTEASEKTPTCLTDASTQTEVD